jgi:hypothetical protein
MKVKTHIDATVDHLFKTNNERQIVKAFFYRIYLNWTPREAGRELGLSVNQINALNSARLYRLSEEQKYGEFVESYKQAYVNVGKFSEYKLSKNHLRHVRGVQNRLTFKHRVLIAKLER